MESLTLLSGAAASAMALPTQAEVATSTTATATTLTLGGAAQGTFYGHQRGHLVIYDDDVKAAGKLTPIGAATITGTLQLLPGIVDESPSGTLHLTTGKGTLTLQMSFLSTQGLPIPTSPHETIVPFEITNGTGAYQSETGTGLVEFTFSTDHSAGSSQTGGVNIKFSSLPKES